MPAKNSQPNKKTPVKKKAAPKKVAKKKAVKRKAASKKKSLDTCFVVMPFADPISSYYEAIFIPAIKNAKLTPVRADDLFRSGEIVTDLWQMIQKAEIVLAELTTKNANVFYELGLSHAIGKPTILVTETMDDVPFDLRHQRVLEYDKNDPRWGKLLQERITKALKETIESPKDAIPAAFRKKVASQAPEQDAINARLDELESEMKYISASQNKAFKSSYSTHGTYRDVLEVQKHRDAARTAVGALTYNRAKSLFADDPDTD